MNGELWRLTAKYETVCERCRGYVKKGAQIVKEPGHKRYSHAVCPADLAKPRPTEPVVVTEYRPVYDADGNFTMEEVAVLSGEEADNAAV